MDPVLRKYDFYSGPQALGEMWTLTRDALTLRCAISTHRQGWELRLTAGANFLRAHVCRSQQEVFDVANAWRDEAAGKGWS